MKRLLRIVAMLLLTLSVAVGAMQAQSTPATQAAATQSAPNAALSNAQMVAPQAAAPGSVTAPGGITINGLGGNSTSLTIVVLLTFLTLIPSILICMTPFARLLVVFHFLRQALGLQTTPSNQTLVGLSLIMTFFLMQPVGNQIYHDAIMPLQQSDITAEAALDRAAVPMRHFMSHYVREKDLALFLDLAHEPRPHTIDDVSFRVLLPSYILSELKAGFQIGAVLFLMVDGWHLLIGALMRSFN